MGAEQGYTAGLGFVGLVGLKRVYSDTGALRGSTGFDMEACRRLYRFHRATYRGL